LASPRFSEISLPLQVAAICYRCRGQSVEFLLVNTNGGSKWTFPKGTPEASMSHSQAAEREAWEEAGARGHIELRHFHLYIHSKGVFWKPPGVREYVVKAFLMEVDQMFPSHELNRNPTWFSPDEARAILAKGREVKYAVEQQVVVDRAMEQLQAEKAAVAR
jgi:8-oxo-dGTP pyrophosphatase MutT (NUDIX family)